MFFMTKILLTLSVSLFLFISSVFADVVNEIEIKNNNRISKEKIITYWEIELNKDYGLMI